LDNSDLGGTYVLDNPGLRRPEHGVSRLDRDLLGLAALRGDLERAALEINRDARLLISVSPGRRVQSKAATYSFRSFSV
jgi:hypothetical protein